MANPTGLREKIVVSDLPQRSTTDRLRSHYGRYAIDANRGRVRRYSQSIGALDKKPLAEWLVLDFCGRPDVHYYIKATHYHAIHRYPQHSRNEACTDASANLKRRRRRHYACPLPGRARRL